MKIKSKTGIVSCSGECCSLGTLSRVATRLILEEVKPNNSVTICLPLFLAGGEEEREFAKVFPTISIDGCSKECAKQAIEKYSGNTAASVVVEDMLKDWKVKPPRSRRELDDEGFQTAHRIAEEIGILIEGVGGRP
jgi:uncharacterized metal-binding protein